MNEAAMYATENRHPCAICQRPIIHAFLMCGQHWRLVPPEQQLAVYRAWGELTKIVPTGKRMPRKVLDAYLAAKDAAIASAEAALPTLTPTPTETAA